MNGPSPEKPLPPEDELFDGMVRGLVTGDNAAYAEFWDRYGHRLNGVVRSRFPESLKRRLGPEDLVQSVCRSFFRQATAGHLQLSDAESLWRLLCAITLNKMKMKYRFHSAQRRGVTRERDLSKDHSDSPPDTHEPAAKEDAPDDAVMFADQLQQVMNMLDPYEQQIVQLKLEGCTNDEIAEKVRRSERTVRRMLQRLQTKLETALPDQFRSPSPESP